MPEKKIEARQDENSDLYDEFVKCSYQGSLLSNPT